MNKKTVVRTLSIMVICISSFTNCTMGDNNPGDNNPGVEEHIPKVYTLAGSGEWGNDNGVGSEASFSGPYGISTDGINLYVCDYFGSWIRKIEISTGIVSVYSLGFQNPTGLYFYEYEWGNRLYVTEAANHIIKELSEKDMSIEILSGIEDTAGYVDGFSGAFSKYNNPYGITKVGDYLYVGDSGNNCIRQVNMSGGSKTFATIEGAVWLTSDGSNLYVTSYTSNIISKIPIEYDPVEKTPISGTVATIVGDGKDGYLDGIGTEARVSSVGGIAYYDGYLYFAETYYNVIRRIDLSTMEVTTYAGSGQEGSENGELLSASFYQPKDIEVGPDGTLYISDYENNLIRYIK